MNIKNKTAGHAGIACFSFALKGNRAGSPHKQAYNSKKSKGLLP